MDITSGMSSLVFIIMPLYFTYLPHHIRLRLYVLSVNSSMHHIVEYNNMNNVKQYYKLLDSISIIMVCNSFLLPADNINITLFDICVVVLYLVLKWWFNNEHVKKLIYFVAVIKMGYECPLSTIPFLCGFCGFLHNVYYKSWNHYNRTIWHVGNAMFIGFSSNCMHAIECT